MKEYKKMFPSFSDYNSHNQAMSNHPLFSDNPRPIFNTIEDTLDYIDKDISVVQGFYDTYLPHKMRVTPETPLLQKNSMARITDHQLQQQLNADIKNSRIYLAPNEIVFHGGTDLLPPIITEPLSTSFSPTVAYNNALHKGKAFDAGGINLYCLTIEEPNIPVYVYQKRSMNQEHEVLFASGVNIGNIVVHSRKIVTVFDHNSNYKKVPFTIYMANLF